MPDPIVETTTPDEDFTAAFAQFNTDEPVVVPTPVTEPEPAPASTPEPEPAPEIAPEPEPAPEITPEPEAKNDDLLERLAAIVNKQQAPAAPEPAPEITPQADPELYTAAEKTFLAEYEKDWPDVARAEALRRRAEYRDLVNHVFSEVAKELGPVAQTLRTLSERAHLTDLRESVDDYDDVRDKVIDWVNNQPSYLQTAYKHVIQQGTPMEVADLVSRYKTETGISAPMPTPAPKMESELPLATKQAVASLAPVSSKRSTVVTTPDLNDFDGAFAEAAKGL